MQGGAIPKSGPGPRLLAGLGLAAAAAFLGACGTAMVASPGHGERAVLPDTKPAQAYAAVARQIRRCWFDPTDPVLPGHVFRAEVPPAGAPDPRTRVVIRERTPEGEDGLRAYSIRFERSRGDTRVTTENHRLDYALAQALSADVGYWVQGGAGCDGPESAAAPDGRAGAVRGREAAGDQAR